MKQVKFIFKDGSEVLVNLAPHVLDMWINDKKTKSDIAKLGKVVEDFESSKDI